MITYEFPVTEFTGDDPEDAYTTMHTAKIDVEELLHEPYEATLHAFDDTFKLIFGQCHDGFYLCIPNKKMSCILESLYDVEEISYELLHPYEPLRFEAVIAISYALNELCKITKVRRT